MPLTPFHFGPAIFLAAIHKRLNLLALLLGSVILDVEPVAVILYNWNYPYHGYPHHGILHSFFAAFLSAWLLALVLKNFETRTGTNLERFRMGRLVQSSSLSTLFLSAFLGSASHVLFDSLMHYDAFPFWPSYSNPFLGLISYSQNYFLVISLGILGIFMLIKKNRDVHHFSSLTFKGKND